MHHFLADIDHPNLKMAFDLPHIQRWGNATEYIEMLGEHIVNVHMANYTPDFRRVPLGKGEIDWKGALSRPKRLPNLRQITLELTRAEPEDVSQSLELIHKLC
jgi:sugar phosphate isomerase/epimerase